MARNIAISSARTIVYKEHRVERKREVLSLRFYVSSTKVKPRGVREFTRE